MNDKAAKIAIGQIIEHQLFEYRGVVIDVDPVFSGSEEWYAAMARSRPPKDEPWYHVLVDGADHQTYVAERNLESDPTAAPMNHPEIDQYFDGFAKGRYLPKRRGN